MTNGMSGIAPGTTNISRRLTISRTLWPWGCSSTPSSAMRTWLRWRTWKFLGWSQRIDYYIETTAGAIQAAQSGPNPRSIYIAYDEWNVWYRAGNNEHLEETYT